MNKSVVAVALLLIAGAFAVGSYIYSNRIDRDAQQLGSATQRTPDQRREDERRSDAARGPSTTGSKTQGAVPPASQ